MKKGLIWLALTCVMVISLLLASCNSSRTSTSTTTSTPSTSTATSKTTTTSTSNPLTTTTSTPVTTTISTTTTGHWWDSLGTPQYGGTMVSRMSMDIALWDPYYMGMSQTGYMIGGEFYMQRLYCNKYETDPSIFNFATVYIPPDYVGNLLTTSWEMPDTTTFIAHLRNDVYWQNLPPANGRQFVASDVVYHYNRMLGLGNGFTTPSPEYVGSPTWAPLISVTASDKYTVVWKWKPGTSPLTTVITLLQDSPQNVIECPDVIQQWGNLIDWHHSIGTGPYILSDYVSGSSITFTRNPNYWGYDARWPQNKLPYIDKQQFLIIVNNMTAEAAMRTGKIDFLSVSATDAKAMLQTNPNLVQATTPATLELTVDPMVNLAPFNNINVRIAMQHAIDIPTIAKTYFLGTAIGWPASITQNQMAAGGWGIPYPDWPQALKDEYAYNPTLAKQMLASAGFPNGFNTNIVIKASADKDLYLIAQAYFAAININMSITVMDDASWSNFVINSRACTALAGRQEGIIGRTTDPFTQLKMFMPTTAANYIQVNDPKINAWYAQAADASASIDTVKQILRDENLYIAQQHFVISLGQAMNFSLAQPWLKGVAPGTGAVGAYQTGDWLDLNLKKSMGY